MPITLNANNVTLGRAAVKRNLGLKHQIPSNSDYIWKVPSLIQFGTCAEKWPNLDEARLPLDICHHSLLYLSLSLSLRNRPTRTHFLFLSCESGPPTCKFSLRNKTGEVSYPGHQFQKRDFS